MCEPVQKPLLDCDWLSRTSRRCVEHLFFTYLNLVRIPKWNAGKRWYSGPSTSGRGGHGNGRGQALRVVRNGQGREISPYRCRPFIILHRCAPAHLRDPHDLGGLQTGQPRFCMDAIKVARSSWRRPSSAKTAEEGQRRAARTSSISGGERA